MPAMWVASVHFSAACDAVIQSLSEGRAWRLLGEFSALFRSKPEVAESAQGSDSSTGLPIKFAVTRRTRQPKRYQKPMVNRNLSG